MTEQQALDTIWAKTDASFFFQRPDRQTHMRNVYQGECEAEFRSLGDHLVNRRRILLWRVPKDNPHWNPDRPQILKVPFLAFADEVIEDTDQILLPILHKIMENAAT